MFSYIGRSAQLAPTLKGITQAVANGLKIPAPSTVLPVTNELRDNPALVLTTTSMAKKCTTGRVIGRSGIGVPTQVRHAHSDLQVPDFDRYRRNITKDPNSKNESQVSRSLFTYMIVGGGSVMGVYAAKAMVRDVVTSMSASKDVLALAQIEINMAEIPEGKSLTFKWRGKPIFVRHRTDEEISTEGAVDMSGLRDPEHDSVRCPDPKWLIVIGVCTHLGCVPIHDAGLFGGYYCPCHGSHYDAAGRIRKGPAPLNLEIPEYTVRDGWLIVG